MTTEAKTNAVLARVVGAVYLAGFVVGLAGEGLFQSVLGAPNHLAIISANRATLAAGALLWLMAGIGDAAHGVLMFPILKRHSERAAAGYLAARIVDAIFIAIMVLFILLQIPLGGEYLKAAPSDARVLQGLSALLTQGQQSAYQIGMSALGVSGVVLCATLYRARLLPRWLATWGLVGYLIIFCGMLSEIMGSGLGLASSIPGGLWEVFVGVWLIVRGFSTPVDAPALISPTSAAGDAISLSQL